MFNESRRENTNLVSTRYSFRTKLIGIMLLLVAVPMVVSTAISYILSTDKAMEDARDSLEWQAWYMENLFAKTIDKNVSAMKVLASAPSTIEYLKAPSNGEVSGEAVLAQMRSIDTYMDDGGGTILTGLDGWYAAFKIRWQMC